MQPFRFRLDGLLRLRSQLERTSRRMLADATSVVVGVEQRMAAATAGQVECEQLGCSSAPHAPLARALAEGLLRHRRRLQHELRAAEARLDRARGDWLDRRRDHKVMAMLRDRRHEQWRREQQAAEQREIEELTRWSPPSSREERT